MHLSNLEFIPRKYWASSWNILSTTVDIFQIYSDLNPTRLFESNGDVKAWKAVRPGHPRRLAARALVYSLFKPNDALVHLCHRPVPPHQFLHGGCGVLQPALRVSGNTAGIELSPRQVLVARRDATEGWYRGGGS